jgi:hypothetical protein
MQGCEVVGPPAEVKSRRPLSRKVGRQAGRADGPLRRQGANVRGGLELRACGARRHLFDGDEFTKTGTVTDYTPGPRASGGGRHGQGGRVATFESRPSLAFISVGS